MAGAEGRHALHTNSSASMRQPRGSCSTAGYMPHTKWYQRSHSVHWTKSSNSRSSSGCHVSAAKSAARSLAASSSSWPSSCVRATSSAEKSLSKHGTHSVTSAWLSPTGGARRYAVPAGCSWSQPQHRSLGSVCGRLEVRQPLQTIWRCGAKRPRTSVPAPHLHLLLQSVSIALQTSVASQLPLSCTAVTSATFDFLGGRAVQMGLNVSGSAAALPRLLSNAMCIPSVGG
mmetsp:Transcript_35690/g.104450  ORF Transcript_35690/g.104450 Transcript_35690/m.104450 type:complete len:230 (-) Transcript_35690:233-922(-)